MSGLSGLERTLSSLGTSYGDLNTASEVFDTSVLDNWRDDSNKKVATATAENQTKDAQGEAFLGLGVGEYPTYKLLKGIVKKGYNMYNKKGSTEDNGDGAGDGETAGNDAGELQFDSMPDASGFEGLDDAPTTFGDSGSAPDPDASLSTPEELSAPPEEPDIPESNVFEPKQVEVSDDFKIPEAPKAEDLEQGFGEADDFDLLPSGLGETPQITNLSTVSSTQGGSYAGTGTASGTQELSGIPEQQGALNVNRARGAGEDLPQAQEGLAEGQELDSLAPLREQFGLNQPKPAPEQPSTSGETSGASGESAGASGESATTDLTTNLAGGAADDTVSGAVGGLTDTITSSLTSGASDALATGAAAGGEGLLSVLGGAAGEAGAAVLGAIPGVAEVAAVGAAVYGVVEGLEDLFGGHKSTKPPPPPKPATFNFKGSSLGQQAQIALPSVDGVVDSPASLTAF